MDAALCAVFHWGTVEFELLATLDPHERRETIAACQRRRFARNEVIFHQGDPASTLHLIAKGRVAFRATTSLGDVVTLNIAGPGTAFGELALLSDGEIVAAVEADEYEATWQLEPSVHLP